MKLKGPNFQLSILARSALIACSAGASLVAAQSAIAQSAAPETALERVEIVGSNIKRVAKEGAVPVVIITKEDIAKTGATTVQELVKNLGISGGQQINTGASGSFVTGASAAGFRGLPATDTLVLLNGRRIAPYGRSEQTSSGGAVAFVDLNSLPLSAVEQVQILKDGASAIYGADAVAGVMNVITKKNYTGAEVNLSYGQYGDPGGQDAKVNATLGFGDFDEKGYNGMLMLEKSSAKEIWNKDRAFTKTYDYRGVRPYLGDYRSSYSPYGNYGVDSGAIDYGAGDNCPAGNLRGGLCRYDFGNVEQVQPATDRMSAMFVGNLKLTNDIKAFSELAYNQNKTKSASRAPALTTESDFTQVDGKRGLPLGTTANLVRNSLAAQYNALGTDPLGLIAGSGVEGGLTTLDLRTRFTEYGPRTDEITTDSLRYVLGLKGTLANTWDWETAYMVSEQTVKDVAANEINKELLADLLVNGLVTNLFTDSTNKGGYASARYIGTEETKSKLSIFDFKMSGELTKLPAGPLGIAFGGESRKENMDTTVDPVTAAGLKTGSASVETSGSRDVNAVFGELSIPITSMVEAQVAVRSEHYSDFGTSTNPKVAVRFQPTNELLFRASSGKAFKAPTLFQLYEGQSAGGYEELTDTLRCNAGVAIDCDSKLFEVRSGGVIAQGLTLNPEKSTNTNLGVVWSPSSNFNVSVDYWQINKTDAIIKADAQTLIDNNSPAVLRNPTVGGVPGSIVRVTSTYFNANEQEIKGIDFDVNAKTKLAGGTLGGGASITYNLKFDQTSGGVTEDLLDNYVYFIVPRYRAQFRASYDIGKWTTAAFLNILPGFQSQYPKAGGSLAPQTDVDGYKTVDVFASYSGFKSLVLSGGVRNLFNQAPSYIAGAGPATDTSLYDMRGRYFYFNANYKF